jgi:hypothetical protein
MRNWVIILALFIAAFAGPASAGEVWHSCAVIAKQAQRLACYDLLASKIPTTTKQKRSVELADELAKRINSFYDRFKGITKNYPKGRKNLEVLLGSGSALRLQLRKIVVSYCGALLASGGDPMRAQMEYENTLALIPPAIFDIKRYRRFTCVR